MIFYYFNLLIIFTEGFQRLYTKTSNGMFEESIDSYEVGSLLECATFCNIDWIRGQKICNAFSLNEITNICKIGILRSTTYGTEEVQSRFKIFLKHLETRPIDLSLIHI